jgi:hypothetical protein
MVNSDEENDVESKKNNKNNSSKDTIYMIRALEGQIQAADMIN